MTGSCKNIIPVPYMGSRILMPKYVLIFFSEKVFPDNIHPLKISRDMCFLLKHTSRILRIS